MGRMMLVSVGTGKGVEDGISKSVLEANPNELVLVGSADSAGTVERVRQRLKAAGFDSPDRFLVLRDPNDIYVMMDQLAEELLRARDAGWTDRQFTIDFTSGTKAMSVALALTANTIVPGASFRYVGSLVRDKEYGRVISGEEDIKIRRSASYYLGFDEERLTALLFNRSAFGEAIRTCDEVVRRQPPVRVRRRFEAIRALAAFFADWDNGRYAAARARCGELGENPMVIARLGDRLPAMIEFLDELVAQSGLGPHGRAGGFPGAEFVADQLANARRRLAEGRVNDALLRLARALLALAQFERYLNHAEDPLPEGAPPLSAAELLARGRAGVGSTVGPLFERPEVKTVAGWLLTAVPGYGFGPLPEEAETVIARAAELTLAALAELTGGLKLKWPVETMAELAAFPRL